MKIFISWSGERSRLIAEALKGWLPDVISFFEPWVSSEDIEKGARWGADLNAQLEGTDIGIICLTPENLLAPWILFESGALAKSINRGRVCTYLFDVQKSDLQGPLIQFQATESTKPDTLKLLKSLNNYLEKKARSDEQVERIFEQWWPNLEKKLQIIPNNKFDTHNRRTDRDILTEVLDLVRQQVKGSGTFNKPVKHLSSIYHNEFELNVFDKKIQLSGSPEDPNAVDWTTNVSHKDDLSFLTGNWHSRWYEEPRTTEWHLGTAAFMAHRQYWALIHTDGEFEYFIIGWQSDKNRLLGYRYNINDPLDRSPWVGVIIDNTRIDGKWKNGRWDLRR